MLCLLLCLTVLLGCTACGGGGEDGSGETISYDLQEEPETLDPQIASGQAAVVLIEALYEGLVRLDGDNEPYPGAAASWSANETNTEFTFTLREDAAWSNGDPVTAADFVYGMRRALDPATGSETCEAMYCIENARAVREGALPVESLGVAAVDSRTLVISLEYPYEEFPALTASTPFMPCQQEFFENTYGRYGLEPETVLGNGPFRIRNRYSWEHGARVELTASSTYAGEQEPSPAALQFYLGELELEESGLIQALRDSTVDAAPLPASLLDEAEAAGLPVTSFQDTTCGLLFQVSESYQGGGNIMAHAEVRRAFVQVLDRAALLRYLPENSEPAEDIVTPDATYLGKSYREQAGGGMLLPQSAEAAAGAAEVLRALGIDVMPTVTVLCPDDGDVKHMVNEMLAAWNSAFGNYFNMEPLPQEELESRVAAGDFQVAVYALQPDGGTPERLLSLFASGSESNPAQMSDPAYDALLDQALASGGMEALELYRQAEAYLNTQAVFYPLYYQSHYYACGPGVSGVVFHPYNGGVDFLTAKRVTVLS